MSIARKALAVLSLILTACANNPPAPVVERSSNTVPAASPAAPATAGMYTVKKGDTLYSIALDHGQDYKDIAAWNNLDNPSLIRIGQTLRVTPAEGSAPVAVAKPIASPGTIEVKPISGDNASGNAAGSSGGSAAGSEAGGLAGNLAGNTDSLKRGPKGGTVAYSEAALAAAQKEASGDQPIVIPSAPAVAAAPENPASEKITPEKATPEKAPVASGDIDWQWPVNGKLLTSFAEGSNKGLDIAGKTGDAVQAAADGVVSYAGSGLRGYGNLVVIRHNATWLSVYAHNSKILVKEKQAVKRGQKIAEMGSTDAASPRLHFEIRQQGKPVDPQTILPAR
jgi:lipoprotein NlpD